MAGIKTKSLKRGRTAPGAGMSQGDRAYEEIRDSILKGTLAVGVALSRRSLASELGVSVPPVTEALQRLESEGLVESRPRVGTRVRIPTREEVEERSLLREALEAQAAGLFAERATPAEKRELQRLGRQMDRLYAAAEKAPGDRELMFSVNTFHMGLHLRIAECARCAPLRDAIEREQVLIFNWLYDMAAQRQELGSDFHSTLTEALATGSPALAQAAMRRHIRRGLSDVVAGLERIGKPGDGWRAKRVRDVLGS